MRGGIVGNGVGSGMEDFMSGIMNYFPLGIFVSITFYPFIPGCLLKGVGKVVH